MKKILLVDDDGNFIWLLENFCGEKAMKNNSVFGRRCLAYHRRGTIIYNI